MAIRARLKSKIKSLIFGTSGSPATSTTNPSQTVTKTTFVPPTVSTTAVPSMKDANGSNSEEPELNTESSTEPISSISSTVESTVDASAPDEALPQTDTSSKEEQEIEVGADSEEASFIVEVVDLFPETCPHCGASSHNNWIRIENKFACGSCETAY